MKPNSDVPAVIEDTVRVTSTAVFSTDVYDGVCSDEEYYEEIDPCEAFTCLECNIEHHPDNHVEGQKLKKYGPCRLGRGIKHTFSFRN